MFSFENDPVLCCLLVLLTALVFYVIDEIFVVTPRLASWIQDMLDPS
jgi:hypothetical protein